MGALLSSPATTAKPRTTGRLELGDFNIYPVHGLNGKGLDVLTRTISCATENIAEPRHIAAAYKQHTRRDIQPSALDIKSRNKVLAALVREIWVTQGWIQAYELLWNIIPEVATHPRLLEDMKIAVDIYSRIKEGEQTKMATDLKIRIGDKITYNDITWIGPKSAGGNAWRASNEYAEVLKRPGWKDKRDSKGLSPCILYGWLGVALKMVPPEQFQDMAIMNLLGTVDYDLDEVSYTKGGFETGFELASKYAVDADGGMQIAALAGLISHDFQTFVRPIQNQWVKAKKGSTNLGPKDISPADWSALLVADCAALVPFGFESVDTYNRSRVGVTTGMLSQTCHDLLFDTGCSNRINSVRYSQAAGIAKYGLHAAFANAGQEAMAKTFLDSLDSPSQPKPYFGYNAHLVVGAWNGYNTRYRVWERAIKYTRQLEASRYRESKAVLKLSQSDLILRDFDLSQDVSETWTRATRSTDKDLIPRKTESYFIPSRVADLLDTPGVKPIDLCPKCTPKFNSLMAQSSMEEVRAMDGLPQEVTNIRAAGLAVGIRRAVMWALTDRCCEACACKIGFWADAVGYSVLSALMIDEPQTESSVWCLQNYFVASTTYWPINLPFLLSGFDVLADIVVDEGAMGVRDVVDI